MDRCAVITTDSELLFGFSPRPVRCPSGLILGGGEVYPEINFTLPPMTISEATWPDVRREYNEMIEGICRRATDLEAPGLVIEFELLPPMTARPEWGAEITAILRRALDHYAAEHGLRSVLRVTPTDIRDTERPPHMSKGRLLDTTLRSFRLCAEAGGELLSIESTGGKEVHDEALLNGNVGLMIFALGVLGARDMRMLWGQIAEIARQTGTIAAGDTACGFANTAMVLADRSMISKTFAAVVRVVSVVRSLQAYKAGAVGPSKDCAYEGPYIKAMAGVPIAMEGKSSACAHLSTLGNIAGACCDLWSNESVQNVRLLSASAPVVSVEQLIFDCRLMNQALREGRKSALMFQRWMVDSDASLDPQAWVLRPDVVVEISRGLSECDDPLAMAFRAAELALDTLDRARAGGRLRLSDTEHRWMDLMAAEIESLPRDAESLATLARAEVPREKWLPEEYGLAAACR